MTFTPGIRPMLRRGCAALLATGFMVSALAQAAMADGEVRKVDKSRGKITLKHGEIKNLDMPPMTMVFGVKNKALLDRVKAGDKVKFSADKDASGDLIVTAVEAQK
jgi:Cu(I)/Ag(I) efflux system periplasmic protein CusF